MANPKATPSRPIRTKINTSGGTKLSVRVPKNYPRKTR